jgi:protein TonB
MRALEAFHSRLTLALFDPVYDSERLECPLLGDEMLDTLLESKSKRSRSAGSAMMSVTAHTALIAAALYATAQARVEPAKSSEMVRPIYFPRLQSTIAAVSPAKNQQARAVGHRLIFVEPRLEMNLPPIDIASIVSKPGDFATTSIVGTGPETGAGNGDRASRAPLRADQVEKQVAVVPGAAPPRYPEVLRSAGVEGQVTAIFVVDELGRAEDGSIRFARSDNQLFEDAVRAALRKMRFIPAEIGGRKVRQLVQMPFVFTLTR